MRAPRLSFFCYVYFVIVLKVVQIVGVSMGRVCLRATLLPYSFITITWIHTRQKHILK